MDTPTTYQNVKAVKKYNKVQQDMLDAEVDMEWDTSQDREKFLKDYHRSIARNHVKDFFNAFRLFFSKFFGGKEVAISTVEKMENK